MNSSTSFSAASESSSTCNQGPLPCAFLSDIQVFHFAK